MPAGASVVLVVAGLLAWVSSASSSAIRCCAASSSLEEEPPPQPANAAIRTRPAIPLFIVSIVGRSRERQGTQGAEDKAVPPASTRAGDSQVDSQARTQRATPTDFAGMAPRNSGLNGRCWTVTEPLPRIWEQGVVGSNPAVPTRETPGQSGFCFGFDRAWSPVKGPGTHQGHATFAHVSVRESVLACRQGLMSHR